MNQRCSVVVMSCDKYEEAWNPFFSLLRQYWPENDRPVYIVTEEKTCTITNVTTICAGGISWSSRLVKATEQISSEYVILLLDDFFMMGAVNESEIQRMLSIMDENNEIACVYFKHSSPQTNEKRIFDNYIEMEHDKKYIVNFQAAVWRRDALIRIVRKGNTAWDIEENPQNNELNDKDVLLCAASGTPDTFENDVFPYLWAIHTGYGICKSQWLWNNKKLFRQHGIKVKYRQLKYMPYWRFKMSKITKRIRSYICTHSCN